MGEQKQLLVDAGIILYDTVRRHIGWQLGWRTLKGILGKQGFEHLILIQG